MLETENSSSESSAEEKRTNSKAQDPTCDIISSNRNPEAKKLKRGVYKFFQGKHRKRILEKQLKEKHKELETTANQSQYINASMTKGTSSKFLLRSIEDSEGRLSGPLVKPAKSFMKKNSIFFRMGLDKVEEENDISVVPNLNDSEQRLSHISFIQSGKINLSCASKGLFFEPNPEVKHNKAEARDKRVNDSKRKIGPKLNFARSKIQNKHNGDKDTPRLKKPSLVTREKSMDVSRARSLEEEVMSPKKKRSPAKKQRRKGRFNTSFHINKSIVRPDELKREHMELTQLNFNTNNIFTPTKLKMKTKKKKQTVINGILKPSSFVQMKMIKEELKESMKVINRRVKKMNERKKKKKVKFNKKMLVYKYKAKRTLTTSFEYEKRGWKKDTERHFSKDFN